MLLEGFDQFITQGTNLRNHSFGDSHEDFNKWVNDVCEWLSTIASNTGISAEWVAISVSPLKSSTNAYYDDSDTWEIFDASVSKRLEWLSRLPKVLEKQRQLSIEVAFPDISTLVKGETDLETVIEHLWLETQKCLNAQCYTASVIMMGSIFEALLILRMKIDPADANRSSKAPRDRDTNKPLNFKDWKLNQLIDVAEELGWLKADRSKFSHVLRESRNVVHPLVGIKMKTNFDKGTCTTCWEVLKASVNDLIESIP
jgi:hypothetical protein